MAVMLLLIFAANFVPVSAMTVWSSKFGIMDVGFYPNA